jgi:hypothetical protein
MSDQQRYSEASITMSLMEGPRFTIMPLFGEERECSESELRAAMLEMGLARIADEVLGPARATSLTLADVLAEHRADPLTAAEVAEMVRKTKASRLEAVSDADWKTDHAGANAVQWFHDLAASHEALRAHLAYWMDTPAAKCAECGELVTDEFCTQNDEGRTMCLKHWVDPGDEESEESLHPILREDMLRMDEQATWGAGFDPSTFRGIGE